MRILLPVLLLLASLAAARADELPPDVRADHWATGSVREVLRLGLLRTHGGKFHGDLYVSRYQLAELAVRLGAIVGREIQVGAIPPDVPADHPLRPAVAAALGGGFLAPYLPGRFHGPGLVDRYALARFAQGALRGIEPPPGDPPARPSDMPADHPDAASVAAANRHGILTQHGGRYLGSRLVKRSEMAVVLARLAKALAAARASTEEGELPAGW